MINNLFYISIICVFTNSFANYEKKEPPAEYYEEEAKKDLKNLLPNVAKHYVSENEEDNNEPLIINALKSNRLMEIINQVVNEPEIKNSVRDTLRTKAQISTGNLKRTHMHNSLTNLRNTIKNTSTVQNFYTNNQFPQRMNRQISPIRGILKSRISGGQYVNKMLRHHVNLINIKPEVYPLLISEDKYSSKEIASKDILLTNEFYSNDEDEVTKRINKIDTKNKNETIIRSATSMAESFDVNDFLNHRKHTVGAGQTAKEYDTNNYLHDVLNQLFSKSVSHLRSHNRLETTPLGKFQDMDSDNKDRSKTIYVGDVIETENLGTNEPLVEFMKYFKMGQNMGTSHNTLTYSKMPAKQNGFRIRRSSSTQAGYTQDPDTCKTYNENLIKLWSNLSKLINVTEQPNEKALHNIAIMIQAYLEHQNAKQLPVIYKTKHKEPRDNITEVMIKIKRFIDKTEGSAENITKVIINYLKPDYAVVKSEGCQAVNEEILGSSVDLLYKNYLEDTLNCNSDDDGMARINKASLRKHMKTRRKILSNTEHVILVLKNHFNPKDLNILTKNVLDSNFHKEKIPRRRPINRNRRVFKSIGEHKRPATDYRSGNQNESEKPKLQPKVSRLFVTKKIKKKSLKSDLTDSCEKYATRKLIVSLRPIMERFMGLLECESDNTLRSVDSHASKFNSNKDSRRHRKILSRLLRKNTGRLRNKYRNKIGTKGHDTPVQNYQDGLVHNSETNSDWPRKYSFHKIKGIIKKARESDMENYKPQYSTRDHILTYNEYYQSPPFFDDYGGGIYKTDKVTNLHKIPSLTNSLISLNNKVNTKDRSPYKKLALSGIEEDIEKENSYEYEYYDESNEEELLAQQDEYNIAQQSRSNFNTSGSFKDLTKLRNDKQLIDEKSEIYDESSKSIAEFLKKARDASLQTPEFALPFALNTNKGYVEITHLIKYPKMLVYRPQFLVKNTMPYDDFLKTINNINMTNDEVRLMKIVRHLPDGSVQVLFETEDLDAALEVRNLDSNMRSGSPDPVINYQLESDIDTASEITKADIRDEDSVTLVPLNRNEAYKQIDYLYNLKFNPDLEILRNKEELSSNIYSDLKSTTNVTFHSNSSERVDYSGLGSIINGKSLPSYTNSQSITNSSSSSEAHNSYSDYSSSSLSTPNFYSQLNSHAGSLPTNSGSHPLPPYTDSNNTAIQNYFSSSSQSIILQWWKQWNAIKRKIKQIIGKMASLTDSIDHIIKL